MKLEASKPANSPAAPSETVQDPAIAPVEITETQQTTSEAGTPEPRPQQPAKIHFAETIGADGIRTQAHEAELARIADRATATNGRDPRFKQKNFADWHGWCHWKACFARVQVALHQAEADRWEARKKGRDIVREQSFKARIETEVKRINAERAKLGKPPLTAEQAAVLLS